MWNNRLPRIIAFPRIIALFLCEKESPPAIIRGNTVFVVLAVFGGSIGTISSSESKLAMFYKKVKKNCELNLKTRELWSSKAMRLETQKHRKRTEIRQSQFAIDDLLNPLMKLFCFLILGDPGAVSRAGRTGATKVFKLRRKSPWVPTLTGPFPNCQANAGSWLGAKNALYYCA